MISNKFYLTKVKYSLVNKFVYKNIDKLPKIQKIILNFNVTTTDIKKLFSILLALELIANQVAKLTIRTKIVLKLQIQKGNPVNCNLILRKQISHQILNNLILKILPKLKKNETKFKIKINYLFFEIHDVFNFSELKKHYSLFNSLSKFRVILLISVSNTKTLVHFCKLFQIVF